MRLAGVKLHRRRWQRVVATPRDGWGGRRVSPTSPAVRRGDPTRWLGRRGIVAAHRGQKYPTTSVKLGFTDLGCTPSVQKETYCLDILFDHPSYSKFLHKYYIFY